MQHMYTIFYSKTKPKDTPTHSALSRRFQYIAQYSGMFGRKLLCNLVILLRKEIIETQNLIITYFNGRQHNQSGY